MARVRSREMVRVAQQDDTVRACRRPRDFVLGLPAGPPGESHSPIAPDTGRAHAPPPGTPGLLQDQKGQSVR